MVPYRTVKHFLSAMGQPLCNFRIPTALTNILTKVLLRMRMESHPCKLRNAGIRHLRGGFLHGLRLNPIPKLGGSMNRQPDLRATA
jgi:hypothetical protein